MVNAMTSIWFRATASLAALFAVGCVGLGSYPTAADSTGPQWDSGKVVEVDFSGLEYYPALKSKIGFARAASAKALPRTADYLREIRPAIFCSEIDFDDVEAPNYALEPYPFRMEGKKVMVERANAWFLELQEQLKKQDIKMLFQIIGAPGPYQQPNIRRPAIHPTPTDILGSAEATKSWVSNFEQNNPIMWSIWNEPVHTLAGPDLPKAASDMVDIYLAYFRALDPITDQDSIGLASFIASSVEKGFDGRPFIEHVLGPIEQKMREDRSLRVDFVTLNNYFGSRDKLLAGVRKALDTDSQTTPIIFSQYAPDQRVTKKKAEIRPGSVLNAIRYLDDIEDLLQETDVEHVCLSYWVGGDKAFLKERSDKPVFERNAHFHAVKFFMDLPVIRASVKRQDVAGAKAIAARDYKKAAVLLWTDAPGPQQLKIKLTDVPQSIVQNNPIVKVRRLDPLHGSPAERAVNAVPAVEEMRWSGQGSSTTVEVQVNGPSIVLLSVEAQALDDPLLRNGLRTAKFVRSLSYANRERVGARVEPRGDLGAFDSVRDVGYLGIKGREGAAYAGALFTALPAKAYVNYRLWGGENADWSRRIMAVRVDYYVQGSPARSVSYQSAQQDPGKHFFPWGKNTDKVDRIVLEPSLGSGRSFALDLEGLAPPGWKSSERRAVITLWMQNTGPGTQGEIYLSDSLSEAKKIESYFLLNSPKQK